MPGAHVEAAREKEVEVRLFEFDLAVLLQTLDQCVLELELADESDASGEKL